MVSVPKYTKGRGLAMKKWEKPELKVLGIESTKTSLYGTQAGEGKKWVCSNCYRDGRTDVNELDAYYENGIYHTPKQWCKFCQNRGWVEVDQSFVEPSGPSNGPSVGLS